MTTGALIFAVNNQRIDYVAMAAWNARNIRRHLDIPVAIATNDPGEHANEFDSVILVPVPPESGQRNFPDTGPVSWHNTNRTDAYALTPWDRTLLLDADYVVASDQLSVILSSDLDFACHRWAQDVSGQDDFSTMNYFGDHRMPQWWATVVMFRRSKKSQMIFDCMRMIRDHWDHYRRLYSNRQSLYRNDHALSIALNIENGHTLQTTDIPWSLATVMPQHHMTMIDQDHYRIEFVDINRPRYIECRGQDLHVMAKSQLENIIASAA
jgi:hypothetical protein